MQPGKELRQLFSQSSDAGLLLAVLQAAIVRELHPMNPKPQKPAKPLGRTAYGSIGHLPGSRLGPGDHAVPEGQARICTVKARDKHDRIIVQEKLDGSCVSVALLQGAIVPLGRSGYPAITSPFPQHHLFHDWAMANEQRFRAVLKDGQRIVGEWLALAHGTRYELGEREPLGVFDIMQGDQRLPFDEFCGAVGEHFQKPHLLHCGGPLSIEAALTIHAQNRWPSEQIEGVVYRVERRGEVDFLAKYVRPDKTDGGYLPEISGKEAVWNWRPG